MNVGLPTPGGRASQEWLLLVLLAVISLLPVAALALTALRPALRYPALWTGDGPSITLGAVLANGVVWRALRTSALLAILTGVLATIVGFMSARALTRATPRARRWGAAAAFLPVLAPPIALGVGVQVLALRAGLGSSLPGVLLAHVVPAAGYLTLYLMGVFGAYDHAMDDEARSLGASAWQVLRRVTLPALRRQLTEAMALGALVSWGQLALTLLVGGGVVRTLPVELLTFVRAGDDRLGAAAALMLTVPPMLALGVLQSGARRTGAVS